MRLTAITKVTYHRLLSVAVLIWLVFAAPLASFATSFIDLAPPCCHSHQVGGLTGLFAKHSCCCRRVASHSSTPAMHSRSHCGSACGHALTGVTSSSQLAIAGLNFSVPPAPASEVLAPARWSAPAAHILALRRYQRPPPFLS